MKRLMHVLTTAALAALLLAPSAQAAFGLEEFDVTFTNQDDSPVTQAGSHPFQMKTRVFFNRLAPTTPDGEFKSGAFAQIAGIVADPTAVPRCQTVDFLTSIPGVRNSFCPDSSAVGHAATELELLTSYAPVFNLDPPPGVLFKLGFVAANTPVTIEIDLSDSPPYNGIARVTNTPQTAGVLASVLTLWGNPADPAHDPFRGQCVSNIGGGTPVIPEGPYPKPPSYGNCPTNAPDIPLLTLPRSCQGPLATSYEVFSWQGDSAKGSVLTHDDALPPNPIGMTGCTKLGFSPSIEAKPTTRAAESPSGLDFSLEVHDEGLTSPEGIAASEIRKTVVTLPVGMTANPSSAEGLEVCTNADLQEETVKALPGEGCPDASKLGTVEVETPLLDQTLKGSLFLAEPYRNPFGTLLALYVVIKSPELGILVKQPIKVQPDPVTGQLITTADEIPELPFSSFRLHFREGARSPLVSPPACGTHEAKAVLTPWAGGPPVTTSSSFEVITGPGASPCPSGGTPPFAPGFQAGTNNNNAGSHSPFYMRLTRRDGDQDLTKFSAKLPPGMVAKLAGTSQCSEASIAQARTRTGEGEGALELASPSCPASSQIGRVMAGAGVGAVLTYVPGRIYLAGPYKGAPLSVVAIVPAVAGPFDVGAVVTRQALRIDHRTAEVTADGSSSDPIPHILAGIPLKVRDVRVYVDKPDFTLNPTSCEPFAVGATLWGGGADVFGSHDDSPLSLASRFQAANCASLGFKPRLSLKLKGGTKRGAHPALTGTYRPRAGDANLKGLVLRFPRSAFLDQAHVRTICTRVQFAAKSCPAGATYGQATAYSPLLEQPLSGPVILRSSNHNLPDFVADLHGLIDVEAVARIDSKGGGIRATFEDVPDAPLTKVVVRMQGAKKGLIVNSTDLCASRHRADARFGGQNGKRFKARPVVQAGCGKGGKAKREGGRQAG
ncbi:MAG TPA: hypothetical protein VIS95_03800 [Solirubrobacterales bacterium]